MNEIKVFENPAFGSIRTLQKDDEPWFVGKDVAESLGYINTRDALAQHVDAEDKMVIQKSDFPTLEIPNKGMTIINESGLYSLILSSKLPTAKGFKHWVTSEVLPNIHKHGAYMTPETLEAAILDPDTMIHLCQRLKEEQGKNRQLQEANAVLTVEQAIRIAKILATTRTERMPMVTDVFHRAQIDINGLEEILNTSALRNQAMLIDTTEFVQRLMSIGIERNREYLIESADFNRFCLEQELSPRLTKKHLYAKGYLRGSMEGEKLNYSVMFHIDGHSRRMIVIRPKERDNPAGDVRRCKICGSG